MYRARHMKIYELFKIVWEFNGSYFPDTKQKLIYKKAEKLIRKKVL